ncbi:olfactory receptor 1G1-like [Rhinatrema bivittatum]|uniref:olfactory receptor 1G1-like n=1 Tax=Rhinatrema bivittatum TaxID=194408 RepID=UPI001128FBEE|nr:olfactory receptor 1G1-like [Rhinatrema bivittatum]
MNETIKMENATLTTEFILLLFSENLHQQFLISVMVLLAFLMSMLGNLGFLTLMWTNHHLHTPMYFFLSNLSLIDICNTSVTLSTLLNNLFTGKACISFSLCMTQLYCFMLFLCTEILLLTVMAYDRYVAICHPLHYVLMMNKKISALLVAATWIAGSLEAVPVEVLISNFSFCRSNLINHFFCDTNALIKLSCSDLYDFEILIFIDGLIILLFPFVLILISYISIIKAILKIQSTDRRRKAFSTCSSHLIVVSAFYGSLSCMYLRPPSMYSPQLDKLFSLLYTVLIPMLNPIIYSLRNQDVKNALKKFRFGK